MKLKNKKWITLSVIIGIALLATTALADNISKSPYDQLKAVIKSTTAQMSGSEIESYTTFTKFTLKDNNILLMEKINEHKSASGGSEYENKEITTTASGSVMTSYSFNSRKKNIWYDRYNDIYYLTENQYFEDKAAIYEDYYGINNDPLANEHIDDIERIFDALVGNLKNYVTVVKNEDGTLEFSGSLSDAQIPAVINAITSFLTKQFLASTGGYAYDSYDYAMPRAMNEISTPAPGAYYDTENKALAGIPKLTGDVFIKSVSGRATASEDGLITGVFADIVLSGRDEDKNVHEVNFQIEMNLIDINSTEVTEPDLTGKNVQINEFNNEQPQERLNSKFEGTYKNDMIKTVDGKFEKIGERFLIIEKIDESTISGRYYEVYKEGYESQNPESFDFNGQNIDPYSVTVFFTDSTGNPNGGQIYFDHNSATIQFYANNGTDKFSSGFSRVFD